VTTGLVAGSQGPNPTSQPEAVRPGRPRAGTRPFGL